MTGVLQSEGIGSLTTSSSDIQATCGVIAEATQQIWLTRLLPPDAIVVHPRRWGYWLSLLDSESRPLFLPSRTARLTLPVCLSGWPRRGLWGMRRAEP